MRTSRWLLSFLAALAVAPPPAAPAQAVPFLESYHGGFVSGAWNYDLTKAFPVQVVTDDSPITGFAFAPGADELAYCAPTGPEGRSALWLISLTAPGGTESDAPDTAAAPRILWTAPQGIVLRGPLHWSPGRGHVLVYACRGDTGDLVALDCLTGAAIWVTEGVRAVDAAWAPTSARLAYVTESPGGRSLWCTTFPPQSSLRRLGEGGYDLRWSFDRPDLRWLGPLSDTLWTQFTWDPDTDQIAQSNPQAPRPPGTLWSPDGRLCAVLQTDPSAGQNRLVIYPRLSSQGEVVPLPDVLPQRLLGWSPDSMLLTVLADMDFPVLVGAEPPSPAAVETFFLPEDRGKMLSVRSQVVGFPINAEAGPPAWSSQGDALAYVIADQLDERLPPGHFPMGKLVVARITRRHPRPVAQILAQAPGEESPDDEASRERRQALANLRDIAAALLKYVAEHDGVCPALEDSAALRTLLAPYLTSPEVFNRPGTTDELPVRYLLEPGTKWTDIQDHSATPIFAVQYHSDYDFVAFADGRTEVRGKGWLESLNQDQ